MLTVDNKSPSFGQVNLIRVSKKTFRNPNDLKSCYAEFGKRVNKISGDIFGGTKPGRYLNRLLYIFFAKPIKCICNMEGKKDFISLNKPIEKDYYSFAVYTNEDALTMFNLFSKEHRKHNAKIVNSACSFEDYMNQFSSVMRFMSSEDKKLCLRKYIKEQKKRCYELLSKQSMKIFEDSDIKEFRLDSLEEIKGLRGKLGF